ncbi:unnamed protein product [Haemonchus placei]|uniref:PEST proteolytic signal-containing nuclear protein n=1 Tax=Haemonchus placei TaxID=6290 RepID=A0A158QK05_HAEPC|nr:unnamed protein product [Haemonchus placei]
MKRKIMLSKQPKKLKDSTASKEPDKPVESSTPNQVRVQPLKPKKVKGEKIDMREFNARGPLEMKAEFKGAVSQSQEATTQSKVKGAPGQRPEQEGQEKPAGSKESKGESGAAAGSSDQPRQEGGKLVEKSSIDDRKK